MVGLVQAVIALVLELKHFPALGMVSVLIQVENVSAKLDGLASTVLLNALEA